jgi:hypothetical protein
VDIYFRAKEMEAKYGIPIPLEEIYAMVARNRDASAGMVQQQIGAPQAPMGGMQ